MASVAKTQVCLICGNKLVTSVLCRRAIASQLVVAEAVKGAAFGIVCGVGVDGCGGDFDGDAWRDVLAVGEGDAFEDAAAEGSWKTSVCVVIGQH